MGLRRLSQAAGLLALIGVLLGCGALVVGAATPSAELAFIAIDRNGAYDLKLLDSGRLSMAALTRSTALKGPPVWSPDGTRLAFNQGGSASGLYLIDASGRGLRKVADGIGGQNPVWSPDGTRLAYVTTGGTSFYINLLDLGSGHVLTLTGQERPISTPAWSPDGSRLLFGLSTGLFRGLYVIPVEGGSSAFLVSNPARTPAWSPDGREIVYSVASSEMGLFTIPGRCGTEGLSCNGVARKLADFSIYSGAAAWSPDGQALAYISTSDCPPPYGSLFVLTSESGSAERLFDCRTTGNLIAEIQAPAWSPDGREIALTAPDGRLVNVYTISVATGAVRRLTTLPDSNVMAEYPAWRP